MSKPRYITALINPPDGALSFLTYAVDNDDVRINVRRICDRICWDPTSHYENFYENLITKPLDNGKAAFIDLDESGLIASLVVIREDYLEDFIEMFKSAFE